jgi:hypothetical protein
VTAEKTIEVWEMAFATATTTVRNDAVLVQIRVAIWTADGPPEGDLPTYYGWDDAIPALLKDGWEPYGEERAYTKDRLPVLTRMFKRRSL